MSLVSKYDDINGNSSWRLWFNKSGTTGVGGRQIGDWKFRVTSGSPNKYADFSFQTPHKSGGYILFYASYSTRHNTITLSTGNWKSRLRYNYTGDLNNGNAPFCVGGQSGYGNVNASMDSTTTKGHNLITQVGFGKPPNGIAGIQRGLVGQLYNGGVGSRWWDLTPSQRRTYGLFSGNGVYYSFTTPSGHIGNEPSLVDNVGFLNLEKNGTIYKIQNTVDDDLRGIDYRESISRSQIKLVFKGSTAYKRGFPFTAMQFPDDRFRDPITISQQNLTPPARNVRSLRTMSREASVSFWIKLNADSKTTKDSGVVIGQWNRSDKFGKRWCVWYDENDKSLSFRIASNATGRDNIRIAKVNTQINNRGKQFVAISYDGSQISNSDKVKIYVNGSGMALSFPSGDMPVVINNRCSPPLSIGQENFGGGVMDDVTLFKKSIDSQEANYLYNNGTGITYPFMPSGSVLYNLNRQAINSGIFGKAIPQYKFDGTHMSGNFTGRSVSGFNTSASFNATTGILSGGGNFENIYTDLYGTGSLEKIYNYSLNTEYSNSGFLTDVVWIKEKDIHSGTVIFDAGIRVLALRDKMSSSYNYSYKSITGIVPTGTGLIRTYIPFGDGSESDDLYSSNNFLLRLRRRGNDYGDTVSGNIHILNVGVRENIDNIKNDSVTGNFFFDSVYGLQAYWDGNFNLSGSQVEGWKDKINNYGLGYWNNKPDKTVVFGAGITGVQFSGGGNNNESLRGIISNRNLQFGSGDAFACFLTCNMQNLKSNDVIATCFTGAGASSRGWSINIPNGTTGFYMRARTDTGLASTTYPAAGTGSRHTNFVVLGRRNLASKQLECYMDGVLLGKTYVNNTDNFAQNSATFAVGAATNGTSDIRGAVSDVVIYKRPTDDFTTPELNRVGRYLANKMGTTWNDI